MITGMPEVTPESIREWRLQQGLTQEELAEKLGVEQSTVAKWETGAQKPGKGWFHFWQLIVAGLAVGSIQAIWEEYQRSRPEPQRRRRGPRVQRKLI